MRSLATQQRFEEAASVRDRLSSLSDESADEETIDLWIAKQPAPFASDTNAVAGNSNVWI
ncbi:MAG: UvrB/UvrC motif-containing protein, partial [Ilumatobacteraceae bacterium]